MDHFTMYSDQYTVECPMSLFISSVYLAASARVTFSSSPIWGVVMHSTALLKHYSYIVQLHHRYSCTISHYSGTTVQ